MCNTTCVYPCAACSGNSTGSICIACSPNLFLDPPNGCVSCLSECTNVSPSLSCFSIAPNSCCYSSCLTCSGPNSNDCLTCDSLNKPVYFQNNQCKNCPVECGTCDATLICKTCAAGYYIDKINPGPTLNCIKCDQLGEVIHSETKECTNCNPKCNRCAGSRDFCTICHSPYALFPNNTCDYCIEPKEKMYFDNSNDACKFCDSKCYNCSTVSSNCTSCNPNNYLLLIDQASDSWTCSSCTNPGFFINLQNPAKPFCAQCNSTCTICTDGSTCTQCIAGLYRTVENYCVSCTAPGFYKIGDLCLACDSTCYTCSSGTASSCTACTPDRYLMPSNKCILRQPLKVTQKRFEADLKIVTFTFDQPVQWASDTSASDFAVIIVKESTDTIEATFSPDSTVPVADRTGLTVSQSVTNEKFEFQGANMRLFLKFTDTTKAATIAVVMKSKYLLQKAGDPTVALYSRIVTFSPIDYILTGMDKAMEAAQAPARAAVTSITTLLFIISIPQALVLMKVFQTIDYYIYIDCDYPTNFSKFLEMINKNIMDMLPNIFDAFSDDEGKPVYNRFDKFGLNIHFLKNSGVQLSILMLIGILKLVFFGLHRGFPKVNLLESKLRSPRNLQGHQPGDLLQHSRIFPSGSGAFHPHPHRSKRQRQSQRHRNEVPVDDPGLDPVAGVDQHVPVHGVHCHSHHRSEEKVLPLGGQRHGGRTVQVLAGR